MKKKANRPSPWLNEYPGLDETQCTAHPQMPTWSLTMNIPQRPSFLRRLMGQPAPVQEVDAADMGTAFGMDYCLDQDAMEARASGLSAPSSPARAPQVWSYRRDRS